MPAKPKDAVDAVVDQWRKERPDLDLRAMALFGRLGRIAGIGARLVEAELAKHGLTIGEFDVLAALRRAGAPHRLTPTRLARATMLSTGAMTNRLDRLERAGWVRRLDDPNDRRGLLVELTPEGHTRVEAAVTDHVANEARLLAALTRSEQNELSALLRKLLLALEPDAEEGAAP